MIPFLRTCTYSHLSYTMSSYHNFIHSQLQSLTLSVCLSLSVHVCLSVCTCLSVCLYMSACLSVHVCLSVCTCLSVCLSLPLSLFLCSYYALTLPFTHSPSSLPPSLPLYVYRMSQSPVIRQPVLILSM